MSIIKRTFITGIPCPTLIENMKFLLYGAAGYIGSHLKKLILERGHEVVCPPTRIESRQVKEDLDFYKPDRVVSCTGRTHGMGPNGPIRSIDYLEDHSKLNENVKDNLYGPVYLAILCSERGIHYSYVGTGCIYTSPFDEDGQALETYTEDSPPNFQGSSYSLVKGYTDQLLTQTSLSKHVLTLRIRLPIAGTPNPRNTLCKLVSYPRIHSVQNSITTFTLLPTMVDLMERGVVGGLNFCNKGSISNGRILELYREIVDQNHQWTEVSGEELAATLPAGRSNTVLDTSRLESLVPNLETAEEGVRACLEQFVRETSE